jgi:phage gp36-like protein
MATTAYATLADLTNYGVQSTAVFGQLSSPQQQKALDAANALADGYLGAKFKLPLTSWGEDLRDAVVAVARFKLLVSRGFNPEGKSAEAVVLAYDAAIDWFKGISKGVVTPVVIDSGQPGQTGGPYVEQGASDPENVGSFVVNKPPNSRGW